MLWFALSFLTFSLNVQNTFAQSDVSCLPFYNWTSNSHGQTPCQVASSLLGVCNNGPFPVESLPDSTHYLGPSLQNANPCQCSTVTYSLMSACGACQGRTYLSWSVWSENCAMVYVSSFPEAIPAGVAVPGWAYLDVTAEDNFDQTNAKKDSNATESSAVPPSPSSTSSTPSSTGGKTTSVPHMTSSHSTSHSASTRPTSSSAPPSISVSSSPSPSASAPASSTEAFSEKQANAVGGGVIGGLFGVVIIFTFLYWFILRRRRRLARDGERLASPTDPENASWHAQGPYMAQRQAEAPLVQSSTAPSINNSLPPNSGPHEQVPSSNAASVDSMSPATTAH